MGVTQPYMLFAETLCGHHINCSVPAQRVWGGCLPFQSVHNAANNMVLCQDNFTSPFESHHTSLSIHGEWSVLLSHPRPSRLPARVLERLDRTTQRKILDTKLISEELGLYMHTCISECGFKDGCEHTGRKILDNIMWNGLAEHSYEEIQHKCCTKTPSPHARTKNGTCMNPMNQIHRCLHIQIKCMYTVDTCGTKRLNNHFNEMMKWWSHVGTLKKWWNDDHMSATRFGPNVTANVEGSPGGSGGSGPPLWAGAPLRTPSLASFRPRPCPRGSCSSRGSLRGSACGSGRTSPTRPSSRPLSEPGRSRSRTGERRETSLATPCRQCPCPPRGHRPPGDLTRRVATPTGSSSGLCQTQTALALKQKTLTCMHVQTCTVLGTIDCLLSIKHNFVLGMSRRAIL